MDNILTKVQEYTKHHLSSIKRIAGDTEFDHSSRIVEKLKRLGVTDTATLSAAYMHSILVFHPKLENEIKDLFGPEVLELVKTYKKVSTTDIDRNSPKEFNEAFIFQAYMNLANDVRTLAIRLADKLDSLEASFELPKQTRLDLANKSLYLYAPLAEMLRLGDLHSRLEDTAFKILFPGEYKTIEKYINLKKRNVASVLDELQLFVHDLLNEQKINVTITRRIKHYYSIHKKLIYYNTRDLDKVKDIIGFRLISDTIENCYLIEDLLVNLFYQYPKLRNDYIAHPRQSGYQSLHNTFRIANNVDIEVQIRTHTMHEFNEFGAASHMLYKIGDKGSKSMSLKYFKGYMQENPYLFKNINYWEAKDNPFDKYIYAFTPKGDIIELPKGATILDFAYELHTTLGNRCRAAMVNKKHVGVDYKVQNGDYIEIKTQKGINVTAGWLDIAKTAKARGQIKKYLRKNP